jgi:phage terminase small subunit
LYPHSTSHFEKASTSRRKPIKQTKQTLAKSEETKKPRFTDEVRQSIFCREYARHGNGVKAALSAGYSRNCAKEQAYDLLKRPHIKQQIHSILRARRKRLDISVDRIATELYIIATSRITDIGEIVGGHFRLHDTSELDDTDIAAISEITQTVIENPKSGTKTTKTKVKLYNRLEALKELNRMLGIGQDMNTLINGLRPYGINIVQDAEGRFHLIDERVPAPVETIEVDAVD